MNIKKTLKKLITFILLLTTVTGCKRPTLVKKKISIAHAILPTPKQALCTVGEKKIPTLTIWIHGTRLFKKFALEEYMHAAPATKLHPITSLSHQYRMISVAKSLAITAPDQFSPEHFYVFGWSGILSFEERELAAKKLYAELKDLVFRYREQQGITPRIRLITHSHGGNVALNLAKYHNPADRFTITEAILLAIPIQEETASYARNPFFEKIYVLYSSMDNLQVMDPQGLYKTAHNSTRHLQFSERRLPCNAKLRQAKIKINGHGIIHAGFITKSFFNYLPTITSTLDTWEAENPTRPGQERLLTLYT